MNHVVTWSTEFATVRQQLIALSEYDRLFRLSVEPERGQCLAYLFRQVRRNELMRQFTEMIVRN
jgi:hypothetical protein